jgi:hypothetical protein
LVWVIKLGIQQDTIALKQQQKQKTLDTEVWNNLKKGDSIFVKQGLTLISFYKKGREKLDEFEQKQINSILIFIFALRRCCG